MLRRQRPLRSRRAPRPDRLPPNAGVAALEFALIAPVFLIALAGVVDLGGELYAQMRLEAAVDAAANYAIVNASQVSSAPATLASTISGIVTNSNAGMSVNTSVVVNSGPSVTVTGGSSSTNGTATDATQCYCPTGSPPNWAWGSPVTCGSACTGGGLGGQFVAITASYAYTPMIGGYSFATNGTLTVNSMVQTK